jgi:hypothetical protein
VTKLPPFLSNFRRAPAPNPGRDLAMIRVKRERALILRTAREMRERLGLPPVAEWERL